MAAKTFVRPRHAARAPRHRVLAVLGSGVAAITGFAIVAGMSYALLTQGAFDRQDISALTGSTKDPTAEPEPPEPTDFAAGEPINILMIGSDERNGENGDIGGRVTDGMRGDVTMVMHISGDRTRIDVMSIPRDLRVRIADCQMFDGSVRTGWTSKFNGAFANGGVNGDRAEAAACAMRTVTDFTGIEFNNHYIVVDFSGFIGMVDALDGVPMCIPHDMSSSKANLDVEAGPQVFDGETALAFARARTGPGLGDGTDLMRITRQQELLTNTARKALGMNLLTDVPQLTQFVRAGAESLTLDPQLGSISNIAGLAYHLRNFDTDNLNFYTVPWTYAGDGSGDVLMQPTEAEEMFARLVADEPLADPEEPEVEESTTSPSPSAPASSPNATAAPEPTVTATAEPVRETEQEILDACATQ